MNYNISDNYIYNPTLNKKSISLNNIIDRDFKKKTIFLPDDKHLNVIKSLFKEFISYETFCNSYLQLNEFKKGGKINFTNSKKVVLLDTCSILLNDVEDFNNFNNDNIYIITCGVFLEIIQGINKYTVNNDIFIKDLDKLVKIKAILGDNCVFLMIGRKIRSYWEGYTPSISCKRSNNDNKPHYKLLRDIDTELCRLSNLLNCPIYTKDKFLQKRNNKIIKNKQNQQTDQNEQNDKKFN